MEAWVLALEFIVLLTFLVWLGPMFRALLSAWGPFLFLGVHRCNADSASILYWRHGLLADLKGALVLLGGFRFRLVIVFGGQAV